MSSERQGQSLNLKLNLTTEANLYLLDVCWDPIRQAGPNSGTELDKAPGSFPFAAKTCALTEFTQHLLLRIRHLALALSRED